MLMAIRCKGTGDSQSMLWSVRRRATPEQLLPYLSQVPKKPCPYSPGVLAIAWLIGPTSAREHSVEPLHVM